MVKTSNKRKSVLLTLSLFAFVALVLISCSADSLMNAGETMGKLSSGGYDKCFTSRDALFFSANEANAGRPKFEIEKIGDPFRHPGQEGPDRYPLSPRRLCNSI